ncbi:MAG: hypothetical protein M3P11_08320 [Actinomycetota bacterium]|nr:hypothetical protein [Actinomycetota bacterium]
MPAPERVTHCPQCLTEYGPGVSVCPLDGTLLVAGPDAQAANEDPDDFDGTEGEEEPQGAITVFHRRDVATPAEEDEAGDGDLFWQEEHPVGVKLAIIAREDARDFIAALEAEGVGAKMGDPTPEDGVEIIIHNANLAAAQAILVDFTGDPSLVDDIEVEPSEVENDSIWPDGRPDGDGFVEVSSGRLVELDAQAQTLAATGMDVHMEIFDGTDPHRTSGAIWVAREDLDRARETLHIEA